MRNKKFKIIAHIGDLLSIDETNKEKEVHKAIADFNENAKKFPDVKGHIEVFKYDGAHYRRADFDGVSKVEIKVDGDRPIGFGRW